MTAFNRFFQKVEYSNFECNKQNTRFIKNKKIVFNEYLPEKK